MRKLASHVLAILLWPLRALRTALVRSPYLPRVGFPADFGQPPAASPELLAVAGQFHQLQSHERELEQTVGRLTSRLTEVEAQARRLHELHEHLGRALNRQSTAEPAGKPTEVKKLRKVVVAGLLAREYPEVQLACKRHAQLHFISRDLRRPEFPDADDAVLLVKFISHAWQDAAMTRFGRDRVHLVRGGVSAVIEAIEKLPR
jgi:hypothetical protein